MTKEELEQEAVEKAKKRTKEFACQGNCEKSYVMGALDFAEPREKCIAELENENAELKEEIKNNEDLATIAYMQGAERYKPKWHNVVDGDLPKEESHYWSKLVLFQTNKGNLYIGFFDYANKAWYEKLNDDIIFGVIAWCEIPKYTEE